MAAIEVEKSLAEREIQYLRFSMYMDLGRYRPFIHL